MDFTPLIIPAFIAGIFTFLAPCTLPLVPGYLAFISGVSSRDLKDPQRAAMVRGKVFLNGLFTLSGLVRCSSSSVRCLASAASRSRGIALSSRALAARWSFCWVSRWQAFGIPRFLRLLSIEKKIRTGMSLKSGRPLGSLIFGAIFALGWTPCVGPILGVILTFAASSASVFQGAFLLTVFSLGLAAPLLLIALGMESAFFWCFWARFSLPTALGWWWNTAIECLDSSTTTHCLIFCNKEISRDFTRTVLVKVLYR